MENVPDWNPFLGLVAALASSAQSSELGKRQLVDMLRFVNTHEFTYFHENQKFAITGELHRGGEAGLSTLMRGRHLAASSSFSQVASNRTLAEVNEECECDS